MRKFSKKFFPSVQDETYFESCGFADLITTCYGGRNRKCAEAFVRGRREKKSWDEVEEELLEGQKLQGTLTSKELDKVMEMEGCREEFPFFDTVYKIAFEGQAPETITTNAVRK